MYQLESALSENRFNAEFNRLLIQIDHFSEILRKEDSESPIEHALLHDKPVTYKKITLPIGPVLVMGSSNFPLAYSTLGGDTVSAFAAKCPVIVKAHPYHLATSSFISDLIEKAMSTAQIPDWFYSHIIDFKDHRHVAFLIKHSSIKALGFTGSQKVGKHLINLASTRKDPIPIFAEMGSLNPVVIDFDIDQTLVDSISKQLVVSVNSDAGQFCTKPGVIFIPNNHQGKQIKAKFHSEWKKEPFFYMLHPNIQKNYLEIIDKWKLAYPKNLHENTEGPMPNQGSKVSFCFSTKEINTYKIVFEEFFGPCVVFVEYNDLKEVYPIIETLEGQLTGSFFGSTFNPSLLNLFKRWCGRIIFNDVPTGVNVLKSMHHGGPFPASSDVRFTAVGQDSVKRFQKQVTLQNF